jgi:hypothetical protein
MKLKFHFEIYGHMTKQIGVKVLEGEKDTRLIFIEAIEPFVDRDTYSQITANIDIIEGRLERQGYCGHLYQKLQSENEQLRIGREAAAGFANQKITEIEKLKEKLDYAVKKVCELYGDVITKMHID